MEKRLMRLVVIVIQLVISAVVTATVMPAVLVAFPAAQNQRVGLGILSGILATTFLIVSLVWPRRKT